MKTDQLRWAADAERADKLAALKRFADNQRDECERRIRAEALRLGLPHTTIV